jgi:predicted GH43/DUF377 family glycosyl hydrolase
MQSALSLSHFTSDKLCKPQQSLWLLMVFVAAALVGVPSQGADREFPDELVHFAAYRDNPVFAAAGAQNWDQAIRERGWILKEGNTWRLWYTGYDGTRDGKKMLGLATSSDGLHWTRHATNPIYGDQWLEDMQVVKHGDLYYMFAEGLNDEAQLLRSSDGVKWRRIGRLDVRQRNGEPIAAGPYGTPTALFEDNRWFLFYERSDRGIWLATSTDMQVWRNVHDEPVLRPGPAEYDRDLVALNQVIKHDGKYYAYYHGAPKRTDGPTFWATAVAVSKDLVSWTKYPQNPLLPISENKSSGIVVHDGKRLRLYTMHDKVDVHFSEQKRVFNKPQGRTN